LQGDKVRSDSAWQSWADADPYFGVLSDERFRAGRIDEHREEFFASGERDVRRFIERFEQSFGRLPSGGALDFGCGVGRLSLPLASRFDRVLGLDVAPAMLVEARANAERFQCPNAAFANADDALSNAPGQFAFVCSYIVLQHIPVPRGLAFIERLIAKVQPGGGCMLHVSLRRAPSMVRRSVYWARLHVPGAHAALNLALGRPRREPMMQMNEYPLPAVLAQFHRAGMHDVLVGLEDHQGTLTASLTARRPADPAELQPPG
jgi:2-polyprenyl-3-methyl-5-hydroxy-6-metoxy-1,4-benzoquinol methylase